MDVASILKLGEPDESIKKYLDHNPPIPSLAAFGSIPAIRKAMAARKEEMLKILGPPKPNILEEDRSVSMRDGAQITLRIYTSYHIPDGGRPLIVMYHGGGFCLGNLANEALNCRVLAEAFSAVCVNVDYRLAPENPFPIPIHDAWDSFKWVASNYRSLQANPKAGFVIGGTSAGANFVAILSHLARDDGVLPPLTGQFLSVPAIFMPGSPPQNYRSEYLSFDQLKDAPILDKRALEMFIENYRPDRLSPLMVPLNFESGHANLPPAYVQVCGLDVLRDDGLIYARVLQEAGVSTKVQIYSGMPHAFWTFMPQLGKAGQVLADTVQAFRWLLQEQGQ